MDTAPAKTHALATDGVDQAEDPAPAARKPSVASLLNQAAALWSPIAGAGGAIEAPHAALLTAALVAMREDATRLPDPTDHTVDWGKDPTAAELSRVRELYLQAFSLRDGHDRARLAPLLTNMLRALNRVHAEGTRWEFDVLRLRPLAERAYRLLAAT